MSRIHLLFMGMGIRVWFLLTQFFSSFRCPKLSDIPSILAISRVIAGGTLYRPDRRAGAFMHPRRVQKRAYAKQRLGDCLPKGTLIRCKARGNVPIEEVCEGDTISDGDGWATVIADFNPQQKVVLAFRLANDRTLRASPDHRLFLAQGTEVRAQDIETGDALLRPFGHGVTVLEISEEPVQECYDLTTSSGRIYLPESDVIVHNCEDHAGYWIARLLNSKLVARAWLGLIYFTMESGEKTGHAVCVFTDFDGKTYWVDYMMPHPAGDHSSFQPGWDWALAVAKSFRATFTGAILFEIPCLTGHQGLSFGNMRVMSPLPSKK